jgi:hypothetical protein
MELVARAGLDITGCIGKADLIQRYREAIAKSSSAGSAPPSAREEPAAAQAQPPACAPAAASAPAPATSATSESAVVDEILSTRADPYKSLGVAVDATDDFEAPARLNRGNGDGSSGGACGGDGGGGDAGEIGPRHTLDDDKQRAFDALVDPGMRDALRQRARKLLDANPCFLRALQMVHTDQDRLWIHVVLLGEKQRVSCHVLRALQGTEEPLFGRAEWCLPAARPQSIRVDHNVEHFRHIMRRDGMPGSYEERPGDGAPPPVLLPDASAELREFLDEFEAMSESERSPTIEDILQWPEEEVWSVIEEFATPDEGCNYRSLGAVDQAPTSREQAREMFIARLARVRAELAQYLPTLRALQVE